MHLNDDAVDLLGLDATRTLLADEFGDEREAVRVCRCLDARELRDGRQDIGEVAEVIAHAARFDLPGPARDHGDAQAALIDPPLLAAERDARLRVDVRAAWLDAEAPLAVAFFEIKEHWVAIGLALAVYLALVARDVDFRSRGGRTRTFHLLAIVLTLVVWTAMLVGLTVVTFRSV